MVKYLCSLEPHYIIFFYGKQLICILEWAQLQWYVGEINGKNLPKHPHSQLTPVINLSTASPAAFTAKMQKKKSLWGKEKATETPGDPQKRVAVCPSCWSSLSCVGFFGSCHRDHCNSSRCTGKWMRTFKQNCIDTYIYAVYLCCLQEGTKAIESHGERSRTWGLVEQKIQI